MHIEIPELALVALVGISGSGKSQFARRHFLTTEVVSSDACRGMICDDENDQSVTADAFDLLYTIAEKRLQRGKLTVIDATHVQPDSRQRVIKLAKEQNLMAVAIVLDLPLELCQARNAERPERQLGEHVLPKQYRQLRRTLKRLKKEGFRQVHILRSAAELEQLELVRVPLWTNKKDLHGPFDLIGDVHGCCDELEALLQALGYRQEQPLLYRHPQGRQAFFVGDLVDRGPRNLDALQLAYHMVQAGHALMVPGNHEQKFLRYLSGKKVKLNHGLEKTVAEFEALTAEQQAEFKACMMPFLDALVSHFVLDHGRLVVAHAGMKEAFQGRASGRVRSFALYGETTGEVDSFGLPVRLDWAQAYRGEALVVYGHVPVPEAEFVNNTIDIDTGCVFGGKLTALRYPEREVVQIAAADMYYAPAKPLDVSLDGGDKRSGQQHADEILDWSEISGKQILHTRLRQTLTIQAENAAAGAELLSRFAVDPRWLIYLPPTMSPCDSGLSDYLEHPQEALDYYRRQGVYKLLAQEKHMGSRGIVVLCQNPQVAVRRFGLNEPAWGRVYTRTGRPFFSDSESEPALLAQMAAAAETAGLWERLQSDWLILDCEILPWSAKAEHLIRDQYAAVGLAARVATEGALELIQAGLKRHPEQAELLELQRHSQRRVRNIEAYNATYARYCWPVADLSDLRLAPFHLLASEEQLHTERSHLWHLEQIDSLQQAAPELFLSTPRLEVELSDSQACQELVQAWLKHTEAGGEGMVLKPVNFVCAGKRGYVQPALKVRGREYLRLIYGPHYTEQLESLKKRKLGAKRALAMREFALGLESLKAFVEREPLRRVHSLVAGILALESEPVDPRL